jgi:parallel beta-helix repeat protein
VRLRSILIVSLFVLGGFAGILDFGSENARGTNVSGIQYDGFGGPWTPAGNPYFVVGDIRIPAGQTLTIEPGTMVKFDGVYRIDVDGNLSAIGTEANRINITSNLPFPSSNMWDTIQANPTGHIDVAFTNISYGHYAIALETSTNNTISNNYFSHVGWAVILRKASAYNYIINNTLYISNDGICLYEGSSNNYIAQNNLTYVGPFSIFMASSSNNNTVVNNTFTKSGLWSIFVGTSSHNNITGNKMMDNSGGGILVRDSTYVNVTHNYMINDSIYVYGDTVSHFNTHTIPKNNLVNDKPVHYYKDCSDLYIDAIILGQLILANCENVEVKNLVINHTDIGMIFGFTNNSRIVHNDVSNNDGLNPDVGIGMFFIRSSNNDITYNDLTSNNYPGINLYHSHNNNISNNNFTMNDKGLVLGYSYGNRIYHNNFIDNFEQALDNSEYSFWNNTYPIGGNYWTEYSPGCQDLYDGPVTPQTTGSPDGICDVQYDIDANSTDYFPIRGPAIHTNPEIISTTPSNDSTLYEMRQNVTVNFNKPINTPTFSYTISPDPGGWIWNWRFGGRVAIGAHNPFDYSTNYTFNVTSAIDTDGNPLGSGPIPNPWELGVAYVKGDQ